MKPLSAVYGRVARMRRSWYERHPQSRRRLERPVISVGNLTVGGSGKTPVVAALAKQLLLMGEQPAVLSRGYARRAAGDGVVVVSDGESVLEPVERSGDEPQMLARVLSGVPVLVSPDRYLAGCTAVRRFAATVIVLDDGFQHLQLERDVDLLLVTPGDLDEHVLPSGRLREPLDAAHAAHAVVVPGTREEAARVSAALGVAAAFTVTNRYDALRPLMSGPPEGGRHDSSTWGPPSGGPPLVFAVAGIARPARFFSALRNQGLNVTGEMTFPDHHWYTTRDLARIEEAAGKADADLIVTTEKDEVRLQDVRSHKWAVLPMEAVIEPTDAFASWLRERL